MLSKVYLECDGGY